ncbi:MAG: DUF4397 domain-containing protein, partial [Chloroflexi bacterium]|nr:DUF4397 domain-containing protein [Chloroflexota bacterium]
QTRSLRIGCLTLRLQARLDNSGLYASSAMVSLPATLGARQVSAGALRINARGFTLDGRSEIPLPSVVIVDSSRAQVALYTLTARVQGAGAAAGHSMGTLRAASDRAVQSHAAATALAGTTVTLNVSGRVAVRLPQNRITGTPISFQIDPAGNIQGATLSQLPLAVASATLTLNSVTFGNHGVSATSSRLQLPGNLGSGSADRGAATIDANGLSLAGASISLPSISLGVGGFEMFGRHGGLAATIECPAGCNRTSSAYKLGLHGSVGVAIPGSSANVAASVYVDSEGTLSAILEKFHLTVAGLDLSVSQAALTPIAGTQSYQLTVAEAKLTMPNAGEVALTNLQIRPPGAPNPGLDLGGARIRLAPIKTSGCTINLEASLNKVGDGYELNGQGTFETAFVGAGSCGKIEIEATVYAQKDQAMVRFWTAQEDYQAPADAAPGSVQEAQAEHSFGLKHARLSLSRCAIPIDETGFFLSEVSGEITMQPTVHIQVAATVTAGPQVLGMSLASIQGTMDLRPYIEGQQDFSLTIAGVMRLFALSIARQSATIAYGKGYMYFSSAGWAQFAALMNGSYSVYAWQVDNRFHMTGSALLTLGVPKGILYQGCVPHPCCPNGNVCCCWPWKYRTCYSCFSIPPSDWVQGNVGADLGEFSNGRWGFKGHACLLGYCGGFYVDTQGKLDWGNVDSYVLVKAPFLAQARQRWLAQQEGQAVPASLEYERVRFTAAGDVLISVPVTHTTDVIFGLSRSGDAPAFTLLTPGGSEVTPDNLPEGITYTETITYTAAEAGGMGGSPCDKAPCAEQPLEAISGITDGTSQSNTGTRVRALHAAPGAAALDVLLSGSQVLRGLSFATLAPYATIDTGTYTVTVVAAGTTTPVLAQTSVQVLSGKDYTLAVLGQPGSLTLQAVASDSAVPAAPTGEASLRLANLSPDAGVVDAGVSGAAPLVTNVAYGGVSDAQGVAAGMPYNLRVWQAGTSTVLAGLDAITLAENHAYTLFLLGKRSGSPALQVLLAVDAEPALLLRALHASPGGVSVDVLVDGVRTFSNLPYGWSSEYAALQPVTHTVSVVPAGSAGPALFETQVNGVAGSYWTLAALGAAGAPTPWLLSDDNDLPLVDQCRVRLLHAS